MVASTIRMKELLTVSFTAPLEDLRVYGYQEATEAYLCTRKLSFYQQCKTNLKTKGSCSNICLLVYSRTAISIVKQSRTRVLR